jgi:putative FmdB family regulatory protein
MPIFDYRCRACAREFEALVMGSSTPSCPACQSQDLEKLLSLPAVKSSGTHELAMKAARRRDRKQGDDRARAQREYEFKHND